METLEELYKDTVKDAYSAEKQFLRAMPRLAKKAKNEKLKDALTTHQEESEHQIELLEQIGDNGNFKLSGKVCKAAQGLVEEAKEHLEEGKPGPVLDAAIIACAQKNEHYEITTYGTLATWAQQLGRKDDVKLLKQILGEEEKTDKLLTQLAESAVNQEAETANA